MKKLLALLIGLLTIGMTMEVASAEPTIEKPPQPQYFGDKDQLHLEFDPDSSYVYRGTVYLAYWWYWEGLTEIFDGSKDYIVIEIPWEIKINGEWKRLFENDVPYVYVSVWEEYKSSVGTPIISMDLNPKYIGGYWFTFAKIKIPVDDDVPGGIIYVGVRPKREYQEMELTTLELYYHTWDGSDAVGLTVSIAMSLWFSPEAAEALFGTTGSKIISGTVSWGVSELIGSYVSGGWEKHIKAQVEISYDAYPERSYPPANPPCVGEICPTSILEDKR
ncbi:hypothetical protein OCC_13370 [Thermococcus litoralis DSM 5473]|uniref:Uncharacterized protein n=1 Tax=Thermococcus litoralis (strain ATCC 51850 / DSM 5473 / JCM 8560 / NS-C) TaxID=523849 RepID=S6A4G0_THELN|nr:MULTISPECIES: hypothetical protein [Thermococcus]AGT34172.1 hypothetical protein OCC_13370 [Thermococcus litoralis DSM 5473]